MLTKSKIFLFCIACVVGIGVAAAQSPAVSPKEADEAKQQAARQVAQPLNNQPVWSEIRSGQPQFTSIPGRETNVLIQSQGQTWRAARVPLATGGGFLFSFALIVLAVFYVWRGPIGMHAPPTGRLIERFNRTYRDDVLGQYMFEDLDQVTYRLRETRARRIPMTVDQGASESASARYT